MRSAMRSAMTTRRSSPAALFCAALLLCLPGAAGAYSTNSNISATRAISATTAAPGQKLTVTLTVDVGAIGTAPLRGFYIAEPMPDTLSVANAKVTLGGSSVSVISETTVTGAVHSGCKTVRWIFEKPTAWSENKPVPASSKVVVTYDVTVPTAMTSGTLTFPGMSWVGMIATAGDSGDHFGHEDKTTSVSVVGQPKLALSPTTLSFSAQEGGSNPAAKNVAVSNAGGGTLGTVTSATSYGAGGTGWLKVTASGSANSQTLKNEVDLTGLNPNTYSATVKVSAAGASNSPQSYTVSFTVTSKPSTTQPTIALTPTSLNFSHTPSWSAPAAQTVAATNSGAKTLAAVSTKTTYGLGSGWLTVTASGTGNTQSLNNAVDPTGLSKNTYTATVAVTSAGASNTPQNYTVTLTVSGSIQDGGVTPGPDAGVTPGLDAGVTQDAAAGSDAGGNNNNPDDQGTLEGGCSVGGGGASALALLLALGLLMLMGRRRG
jgi:hypothetical protein